MTWKYGRQSPDTNLMRFVARRFSEPAWMLDIGKGEGANARELRERGHRVITIDKDPDTLPAICMDIRDFEGEAKYDLIYDVNTLCHVENPPIEKIKSWLKPGGIFFTIWPAHGTWPGVVEGKEFTRLVSVPELRAMLAPFSTVRMYEHTAPRFEGRSYLDSWIAVARS